MLRWCLWELVHKLHRKGQLSTPHTTSVPLQGILNVTKGCILACGADSWARYWCEIHVWDTCSRLWNTYVRYMCEIFVWDTGGRYVCEIHVWDTFVRNLFKKYGWETCVRYLCKILVWHSSLLYTHVWYCYNILVQDTCVIYQCKKIMWHGRVR